MRIVHYLMNVRLRDGGVVRAVLDLCALLAAGGDEVALMCCGDAEIPEAWTTGAPRIPLVANLGKPGPGGLLGSAARKRAKRVLEGADAVHLHGMWELSNYQIAALCRRAGTPYIYSPHGMLDDWAMGVRTPKKRLVLALAGRRALEGARHVHFAAAGEMEDSRKQIGRSDARVVPLVFDASSFERLPGPELARRTWSEIGDGRPAILFLSRLVPNKGAEFVIDAAAMVIRNGVDARVVIAGGGDPVEVAAVKSRAASAGVADRVTFTGHVSGDVKLSLLQAATVFVLPTIHENFGFATIEALACACPAVTTTGNMLRAELAAGGGAAIVERDAGQIASVLQQVLTDTALRARMGEAGKLWVRRFLDPATILAQYRSLYA